jgi:hypothetical protein
MSVSTDNSVALKTHNANHVQQSFLVQLLTAIKRLGTINAQEQGCQMLMRYSWHSKMCPLTHFTTKINTQNLSMKELSPPYAI